MPPLHHAPPPAPTPHELVLFVSCVQDKPVTRLPLPGAKRGGTTIIGAQRVEGRLRYDEDAVIGLTRAEVEAHGKIYRRTIAEGNLRARTRQDFDAYRKAQKERQARTIAEAEKAAKDAAQSNGPAAPAGGDRS
jgi:hypothetical protein